MFADLRERTVLVVGGDAIADAVVQSLSAHGAVCRHVSAWNEASRVDHLHIFVWCSGWDVAALEAALESVAPRYVVAVAPVAAYRDRGSIDAASVDAWCRWKSTQVSAEPMNVNVVRYRFPAERFTPDHMNVSAKEIADAVVALCSGSLDAVHGQTLLIDRGAGFCDNPMRLYSEREKWGL